MVANPDDTQLLRSFSHGGSEDAFAVLSRRYAGLLFHTALRETRRADLAEEAAQNALAVLARKAALLPPDTSLAPWLHRAVFFEARRLSRRERRHDERVQRYARDPALVTAFSVPAGERQESITPDFDAALNRLPEKDREVLLLKYFEDWSFEEMARRRGGEAAAWRQRNGRALDKLRRHLGRRGPQVPLTALAAGLQAALSRQAPAAVSASLAAIPPVPAAALCGRAAFFILHAMSIKQFTLAAVLLAAVAAPLVYRFAAPPSRIQPPAVSGSAASAPPGPAVPPASGSFSGPEAFLSFQSFVGTRSRLDRQRLLVTALERINAGNWGEMLARMEKSRALNELSHEEALLFLRRLGECGKEKLAEHCRPGDVVNEWETHLARYAFAGWAAAEPDASWTFLTALPDGNYRRGLMWGWFEAMAGVDPGRALREGARLDPKADRFILETLAAGVAAHDPAAVRSWLEELSGRPPADSATGEDAAAELKPDEAAPHGGDGSGIGERLFSRILEQQLAMGWSSEYVAGLTAWYDQFHGSAVVPDSAMTQISRALHQHRPAPAVLEWIGGYAHSPQTRSAVSRIISEWTTEASADEVAHWLETRRDTAAYDDAVSAFAQRIKDFDPEAAMAWGNTVRDREARDALMRHLGK